MHYNMKNTSEDAEKKIASIIRKELKNENYDDSCWLKAFSKADGDEQKAKVLYIDLRTSDLKKEKQKEKLLEDSKTHSQMRCGRSFCNNAYKILSIPKTSIGIQKCEGCGNMLEEKVSEKNALRDIEQKQSNANENYISPTIKTPTSNNATSKKSNTMNFGEAISSCFKKYATFEGRASRSEFWYFALFCSVLGAVMLEFIEPLGKIFLLAICIPSIAVASRRMHDVGRSGWFQLIPLINIVWLCEESDKSSSNKF